MRGEARRGEARRGEERRGEERRRRQGTGGALPTFDHMLVAGLAVLEDSNVMERGRLVVVLPVELPRLVLEHLGHVTDMSWTCHGRVLSTVRQPSRLKVSSPGRTRRSPPARPSR